MHTQNPAMSFGEAVLKACSYLAIEGFAVVEQLPTLVRFARGSVEVDIYLGRRSFEVGAGLSIDGERFSLSELIQLNDPGLAKSYRNPVVTGAEGTVAAVSQVALLLHQFGTLALRGGASVLPALVAQRDLWSKNLALDVLASQTRPLAEEAFKAGSYAKAVELYSQIQSRLSSSERAKLALAEKRSAVRH
jgi:hypothetical protein